MVEEDEAYKLHLAQLEAFKPFGECFDMKLHLTTAYEMIVTKNNIQLFLIDKYLKINAQKQAAYKIDLYNRMGIITIEDDRK